MKFGSLTKSGHGASASLLFRKSFRFGLTRLRRKIYNHWYRDARKIGLENGHSVVTPNPGMSPMRAEVSDRLGVFLFWQCRRPLWVPQAIGEK